MSYSVGRNIIRPIIFPIVAFIIVAFFIVALGEILLNLFESGLREFERKELWFGVIWGLLVIGVAALLVRPSHVKGAKKGVLDKEVVIGHKSMFVDTVRRSPLAPARASGARCAISPRDTPCMPAAANSPKIGVLPGGTESGRSFRGYIYAQGVRGASNELLDSDRGRA